jgi:hypothetical protein
LAADANQEKCKGKGELILETREQCCDIMDLLLRYVHLRTGKDNFLISFVVLPDSVVEQEPEPQGAGTFGWSRNFWLEPEYRSFCSGSRLRLRVS